MAAKVHPLKLSDLKANTDYPLGNELSEGKCLIHVKLTDLCVKSIEGLMNSEKGAFFSLWFDDSGGTMEIPMSSGGPRKFQFKTAPLRGGEGQGKGNLECVHQEMEHPRQHLLTCKGPLEHRLTVQATDEVYDRTKKLMKEAEEQRKEARAQEIKLVSKGRSKAKKILAKASSLGTSGRKPGRPPQHHKSALLFSGKPLAGKASMASSRSPRSLRDRIIHLLALKPQKRAEIVTRLKKDTKRSESAMSSLDSILSEVSDIQHGTHCLRSHHYTDLNVDTWPFYSDAERQLVRREQECEERPGYSPHSFFHSREKSCEGRPGNVGTQMSKYPVAGAESHSDLLSLPSKRPLSATGTASAKQIETPAKKAKLSTPPPSHGNQQPPPSSQPPPDAPFTAPTSAPHRPNPHPLHTSTFVPQQIRKPWTDISSNPSTRQPLHPQPPAPPVSAPQPSPRQPLHPQPPAPPVSAPQPSPAVVKTPAVPTSAAPQPPSTHHRPSQSQTLYANFVPATSATVTNGLTTSGTSSTSSTSSTGLSSSTLPAAGVQESLKQPMRPVQPAQQDERVKPDTGENKRKDKKGKRKKKEKDKERSQDKRSASKDPSSVEQGSSGGNHGDEEATHRNGQKGEKQKRLQEAIVEQPTSTDASSTSNIPDYISQFPPIESEEQRSEYKRVFNEEYVEYLRIKEYMDAVKEECAVLGERMSQVPKNSGEAKEVRKKIKEKYTELKENKHQQRFQELHFKLSHIKQLVVEYDKSQPQPGPAVQLSFGSH